jgi:malate dehydrogenase
VPLLSQSSHPLPSDFTQEKLEALVNRIQFGGDEVVKAKDGAGSATLSMAYAGAEFAQKIIRAMKGEKGIVAPSYVSLSADPAGGEAIQKELGKPIEYFSARIELGVSAIYVQQLLARLIVWNSPTVLRRFFPLVRLLITRRPFLRRPCRSSRPTSPL